MFWFGDPTIVLIIPAILLGLYAQWRVKAAFNKYAQIRTQRGLTGAEVAANMLRGHGTAAGVAPAQAPMVQHGHVPACVSKPLAAPYRIIMIRPRMCCGCRSRLCQRQHRRGERRRA